MSIVQDSNHWRPQQIYCTMTVYSEAQRKHNISAVLACKGWSLARKRLSHTAGPSDLNFFSENWLMSHVLRTVMILWLLSYFVYFLYFGVFFATPLAWAPDVLDDVFTDLETSSRIHSTRSSTGCCCCTKITTTPALPCLQHPMSNLPCLEVSQCRATTCICFAHGLVFISSEFQIKAFDCLPILPKLIVTYRDSCFRAKQE